MEISNQVLAEVLGTLRSVRGIVDAANDDEGSYSGADITELVLSLGSSVHDAIAAMEAPKLTKKMAMKHDSARELAIESYTTDDDIAIYDDAVVSPTEHGYWVEAYVFIHSQDVAARLKKGKRTK